MEARTITGDEEAALTFRGATSERPGGEELVVIDIGGGSTELVIGHGTDVRLPRVDAGRRRAPSERHLHADPRRPTRSHRSSRTSRATLSAQLPDEARGASEAAIAVAGTPTSAAAIELELEPYDPARVHGHVLELATLEEQLACLAAMPLEERREVDRPAPRPRADDRRRRGDAHRGVRAFGLDAWRSPSTTSSGAPRWHVRRPDRAKPVRRQRRSRCLA